MKTLQIKNERYNDVCKQNNLDSVPLDLQTFFNYRGDIVYPPIVYLNDLNQLAEEKKQHLLQFIKEKHNWRPSEMTRDELKLKEMLYGQSKIAKSGNYDVEFNFPLITTINTCGTILVLYCIIEIPQISLLSILSLLILLISTLFIFLNNQSTLWDRISNLPAIFLLIITFNVAFNIVDYFLISA